MRERDRLDRQYSPSSVARDPAGSLHRYRTRSDAALARLTVYEDQRYGPARDERCHVFPAVAKGVRGPHTPAVVFVHGGHWQESGIEDACFAAEQVVALRCAYVAIGYGLAPDRTVPDMINSVAAALEWLLGNGPSFGIDPERVHVAGSSAGAHLLAAALANGPGPRVRSACLLSGLYDLTEIPDTYVNDAVGLTSAMAVECSPIRMRPPRCDTVLLAAGRHETDTYLHQHVAYANHLAATTISVTAEIVPDRDHFDLPLELADPSTPFGRLTLRHWGLVLPGGSEHAKVARRSARSHRGGVHNA